MRVLRGLYCLLLLLLLVVASAPALAADTFMGYVSSATTNSIYVVDINGNGVQTTFAGGSVPVGVSLDITGKYLYVVNNAANTVTVYDSSDNVLKYTISLTGYGSGPNDIVFNSLGTKAYISMSGAGKIAVINTATRTPESTISVNASPRNLAYKANTGKLYVQHDNSMYITEIDCVTDTVSGSLNATVNVSDLAACKNSAVLIATCYDDDVVKTFDTGTRALSHSIPVGNGPQAVVVKGDDSAAYVVNKLDNNMMAFSLSSWTVTDTVTVGTWPLDIAINGDNSAVYIINGVSDNISVVSTSTVTLDASIALPDQPIRITIGKVAQEASNLVPMQVTFTVSSGAFRVTDANVSIYDAVTSVFIDSDNTDDAGNTVFWLIPGKRYTVTVSGSDVVSSTQSVQVQPNRDQYTINVQTTGWSWNPFDWFNTNGTGTNGSADARRSITSGYLATTIGTTGHIEVRYNDTTGETSSVAFQLYRRDAANATYVLADSGTVAANDAAYNFTILNSGNNTYRFYANGTNPLFGTVSRVGEHTFYNYNKVDMGWPESFYTYFDLAVFLIIAYISNRRKSVLIAGATFELFISWVFLIIGWMNGFGLMVPILITVFAIVLFAYAIAKWRVSEGY